MKHYAISYACQNCGRDNDRSGLFCSACHKERRRLQNRASDARRWRRQQLENRLALEQAKDLEAEVIPGHKIVDWMINWAC